MILLKVKEGWKRGVKHGWTAKDNKDVQRV